MQQSIDSPEQLNSIIESIQKEIDNLTKQRDELAQPSGGKMLKMFGISKEEAIRKFEEQIKDKQKQLDTLSALIVNKTEST